MKSDVFGLGSRLMISTCVTGPTLMWMTGSSCLPDFIGSIPLHAVVVALLCFGVVVWQCRASGSVREGVSSSQHCSHSPKGRVMDPSPEQATDCWDVALLFLQTQTRESCGWMLNGSALIANLKWRLDMRFLANLVSACCFAQARMCSWGCVLKDVEVLRTTLSVGNWGSQWLSVTFHWYLPLRHKKIAEKAAYSPKLSVF